VADGGAAADGGAETGSTGDGGTAGDGGTPDGGALDGGAPDGGHADTGDTAPPLPDPLVVVEEVPAQDDDIDGWFFDPLAIHEVEITLSDASWAALGTDPYSYVLGQVEVDEQPMPDVGVRLRGKIGSFRTLDGKPKFRVDFNQYVEDQRYYGLESLTLNNEVVDCSYLKEPVSYRVFRGLGLPAPRTSFAHVTVNGMDYGLYVVIETPDDRFLSRVYDDPSGNLYDGKYIYYDDGSYKLLDFTPGAAPYMELEEGTDVDNADVIAVADAVRWATGSGVFEEALDAYVDFDELHRHLLAEEWVGHLDGYALNTNNYRVYLDPADEGRLDLVPYDLDYSMLEASVWGMSWSSPRGVLASGCWSDPTCASNQRDAVADGLEVIDRLELRDFVAELNVATLDAAREDPRRECSFFWVTWYRAYVANWVETRSDLVASHWEL